MNAQLRLTLHSGPHYASTLVELSCEAILPIAELLLLAFHLRDLITCSTGREKPIRNIAWVRLCVQLKGRT